ncbi:MAG: DUF99 family protein [Deltaproteobacteria bacterium]|nr:DUF99 family protein [Deltaproteobacteria bacterium]
MLHAHILGIDDAPFAKGQTDPVPIVGVMMEGADLVESVALASFPVDGDRVTDFLADWVAGLRSHSSLQGVVLGGITIAGLGVIDITSLSEQLMAPVLVATRREPTDAGLTAALRSASLADRIPVVERSPRARRITDGLFLACAGIEANAATEMVRSTLRKAQLPEPLRLAHLIGRAIVTGESRGRV